ncbi:MAG: dethiobiotin synthase [Muribaculaceae bacterium]|nr:dethiobiotin synthase [Muribaculaceae bacterium]
MNHNSKVIFVSGIHTDAGKSYATGWLASRIMAQGRSVITQKFIQTGNSGLSEDIAVHRRLMGTEFHARDLDHTTAPLIFSYPCSPQLAAEIDGRDIDLTEVDRATSILAAEFDTVLVEGAGGLMVPVTDDFFTIDYVASRRLPLCLVTNGSLGSINHTVLSLEAVKARGITLDSVIYNQFFDSQDQRIAADTVGFIGRYLDRHFPGTPLLLCPPM